MENLIDDKEALLDMGERKKYQLFSAMMDGFIMRNKTSFCFADINSTFQSQGFSGEALVKNYARWTTKAINDGRIEEVTPSLNDLRTEGILYKLSGVDRRKKATDLI